MKAPPLPSTRTRLAVAVFLLAILLAPLAVTPRGQGWGSHVDLGLSPCPMMEVLGRPCPTCGVTTAWALWLRGRWGDAFRLHPAGIALHVSGSILVVLLLLSAIGERGRSLVETLWAMQGRMLCAFAALFALQWALRLAGLLP